MICSLFDSPPALFHFVQWVCKCFCYLQCFSPLLLFPVITVLCLWLQPFFACICFVDWWLLLLFSIIQHFFSFLLHLFFVFYMFNLSCHLLCHFTCLQLISPHICQLLCHPDQVMTLSKFLFRGSGQKTATSILSECKRRKFIQTLMSSRHTWMYNLVHLKCPYKCTLKYFFKLKNAPNYVEVFN